MYVRGDGVSGSSGTSKAQKPEWTKPPWEQQLPTYGETIPETPKKAPYTSAGDGEIPQKSLSGSNGGNISYGTPVATYDPTAQLNAFYSQQQAAAEAAAQRQAEILQQQYERQKAAEAEARAKQEAAALGGYNSLLEAAKGSYDSALNLRDEGYAKSTGDVNSATERAMQQAYIANQMQTRNLGQQMAALGRSGGASESTLLGLSNEYGNTRGELDTSRNGQLATLAAQLSEGKASDLDAYNQAKAGYDKNYQDRIADLAAASLDRLLNYDNTYTSGLTQIEQSKAQTLAEIQAAQNQALMEAQQALAEQQAAALAKKYSNSGGGSTGLSESGMSWLEKMTTNVSRNPFTQTMSDDEKKAEIKYAIQSAYQQGTLSKNDAELIAAQQGV